MVDVAPGTQWRPGAGTGGKGVTALYVGWGVALVSGLVQGCAGFGIGMVAASSLMLLMPPAEVVPVVLMMSIANTGVTALHARRHIRFELIGPLVLGALLGMAPGLYVLKTLNATLLKGFAGAFVLLFALLLLSGWRKPLQIRKRVLVSVGLMSGFLGASASMGGPPVILFLANQETPKDAFRASLLFYFFTVNCGALAVFRSIGLLTAAVAQYAVLLMPALLLGTFLGVWLSHHVPEALFRRLAMLLVACMGAALLGTSLWGLV